MEATMKHRIVRLLAALLLSALLVGCSGQEDLPEDTSPLPLEEEGPETDDRVILPEHFALPYAPDLPLDGVDCPDGMQQVVSSLLCEGLFRLGPDFQPIPNLCSGYTYDAENLTYTLSIRSSVTFSDGTPLTPDDVKATLDRARKSERYAVRLADIASVSAGGASVTVTLSAPNAALPALLDIPISKAGTERNAAPTGTGPYLFSVENGEPWLIANQSWWRGGGQPADRIALVECADLDTKLYRFTSHDVQLITADLTGTSPITASGNTVYQDADTTVLQYLGINTAREGLDDAALRRALSLGIDRSHIVSAFLSGHGKAAQFPVSPVSPLYPAEREQRYAPESFAAALESSGYAGSRTLKLLVNEENTFKVSVAQYLADTFTAAGIPMEARILPWADYTAALAAGDFDLYYGEVKLSADWDVSALLATGGALNYGGWSSELTDMRLAACAAAEDRAAAMDALCFHLQQNAPIIPLCFKSTSVLMQADVLEGLSPTMTEPFYNLAGCTINLRK